MIRRLQVAAIALVIGILMTSSGIARAKEMVQPVTDNQSFDRTTYQADYDHVWQVVFNLLSAYRFEFARKDKNAGQIETGYVIFSHNPRFSKLTNGVRTYGNPPKAFLKKWSDGRIKLAVQLVRLSETTTQVILRLDLQGFAETRGDDTGVTGEWRPCRSNGKFEFELFNEVATELRKAPPNGPSNQPPTAGLNEKDETENNPENHEPMSAVIFQSVPEGAEIYLNDKLIGMTPTRLSLSAGAYRVAFRKTGYKEYQREFVLFPRSDVTIGTEMDKE